MYKHKYKGLTYIISLFFNLQLPVSQTELRLDKQAFYNKDSNEISLLEIFKQRLHLLQRGLIQVLKIIQVVPIVPFSPEILLFYQCHYTSENMA